MTTVFLVLALVLSTVLAGAIGRAGWLKAFSPIVELVGSGVVWVADIPRWSVRFIGVLELAAAVVIPAAPIVALLGFQIPALRILGIVAALAVAVLMAAAALFHRARGETVHTWKTLFAFFTLAIMTAAAQVVSG